ncbi:GNAT family N-acetyltransferase [Massilia sp. TWP1-3-3]|uniref:GNAT family N-acetyltransferase n=1 Tax=Massilia sp. TWP1-3-3 TaxID=2804573 RepID=UPI003CE79A6D
MASKKNENMTASARRVINRDKLEADIVAEAVRVFAASGYEGASIATVAENAGLSKQNLMYYFPTKQALYERVLDGVLDDWLARMDSLADPQQDPRDVLRAYVQAKLKFSREQPWASRVYAMEVISGAQLYGDQIQKRVVPLLRKDIEVFERWIGEGKIGPVNATHLLFAIWAMTQSYADFSTQMALVLNRKQLSKKDFEDGEMMITNMVLAAVALPLFRPTVRSGWCMLVKQQPHSNNPMPAFSPITLTTDRLTLRWLGHSDTAAQYAIYADDIAMRYWSSAAWTDMDQARASIEQAIADYASGKALRLAIELRDSGAMIGNFNLYAFSESNRRCDVGYALNRAHWGQGYLGEAMTAALNYAFTALDLHRIEADIDPRNAASAKLLERKAFQKEGYLRERWIVNGEICDTVFYGLLRRDWEAR